MVIGAVWFLWVFKSGVHFTNNFITWFWIQWKILFAVISFDHLIIKTFGSIKSVLSWYVNIFFIDHLIITWIRAERNIYVIWNTVKCHYNANASLTRSILGSQTTPTCPHDHPRVAQHMGYRCEIIVVWSATAAMTPLCSHTNGIKQRYPTCWLCQYSRFMIDLRSNTLIIHLRCSENSINRPIWLPDARMLKTISVAIKLT